MDWFESIVYGLISGLARFLPISSTAHMVILDRFFGVDQPDPLRNFLVYIALLAALITGFLPFFEQLRREQVLSAHARRSSALRAKQMDLRLAKNALFPMLLLYLIFTYVFRNGIGLVGLSVILLLNGIILFVPERMMQGNKGAQSMSVLDSYLIGLFAALAAIPGFSGIGCIISICVARGADRIKSMEWAAMLCLPVIAIAALVEFAGIFSAIGADYIQFSFFGYLLSIAGAYLGGYFGVICMKYLSMRNGISGFAYYSWGAALFSFMLYLTVA